MILATFHQSETVVPSPIKVSTKAYPPGTATKHAKHAAQLIAILEDHGVQASSFVRARFAECTGTLRGPVAQAAADLLAVSWLEAAIVTTREAYLECRSGRPQPRATGGPGWIERLKPNTPERIAVLARALEDKLARLEQEHAWLSRIIGEPGLRLAATSLLAEPEELNELVPPENEKLRRALVDNRVAHLSAEQAVSIGRAMLAVADLDLLTAERHLQDFTRSGGCYVSTVLEDDTPMRRALEALREQGMRYAPRFRVV